MKKLTVLQICLIPQVSRMFLILRNFYSELTLNSKPMASGLLLISGFILMSIHYQGASGFRFPASHATPIFLGQTLTLVLAPSIFNGPSY